MLMPSFTPEARAQHLTRMGNYLDMVEAGLIPCNARQYQLLAKRAAMHIAVGADCSLAAEAIALSPALQELRSNLGLARAIRIGLLELPLEAVRALKNPA